MISAVIEEIQNFRNEKSFKLIYDQIVDFTEKYDIDLKQKRKGGRARAIPTRFASSIITSTIARRDDDNNDEH